MTRHREGTIDHVLTPLSADSNVHLNKKTQGCLISFDNLSVKR